MSNLLLTMTRTGTLLGLILVAVAPGQTLQLQPKLGAPLSGLSASELQLFEQGRADFNQVWTVPQGLGPTFNQNSCASCHNNPVGGSGTISVTRFGLLNAETGVFDPLTSLGGSVLQSQAISVACQETVPAVANVVTQHMTPSALGFGLVEAIADADIVANATNPPSTAVSGVVHMVHLAENPTGPLRAGRFGWKSQAASVLSFSAGATLNELGITNRIVGQENAPNGNTALLLMCDTVPDPEDGPDPQGLDFIDRVNNFQRFLAAPPQTPRSGMTGEGLFMSVGCGDCHTPAFTTSNDPLLETALRNRTIRPYSDFLLHDMGAAADFIGQGAAGPQELRTPLLWGVRLRDPLWHDGRVSGGTLADRLLGPNGVIVQHAALQSEAAASALAFMALSSTDQAAIVAFLESLGRAEFDGDGNNIIDHADLVAFQLAQTGPGSFYSADDPQAVFDVDQDGDVDAVDFGFFIQAYEEDCNGNGVNDLVDILVNQTSFDANGNFIPDECEFCQQDLGFGSPGSLALSVCGDDLTLPGSQATVLFAGAAPGAQLLLAVSGSMGFVPVTGGAAIIPALPLLLLDTSLFANTSGVRAVSISGGGPPVQLVLQFATIQGGTPQLSNAVLMQIGQ